LLTRIVERLRAVPLGYGVHVDDGWRSDRDISIGVGVWAWAHVRALVEDHGTGRCLFRARLQLRLRLGTALILAVATTSVVLTAMRGFDALFATVATGSLILMMKIGRDVTRDARQVFDVVAAAAGDFGMQRVAVTASDSRADISSWTRPLTRPEPTQGA
jgi:hypothetical protein